MSNKRLEHELKMQSKQIEEVFARHEMQAQVTNGEVRAVKHEKQTTFDVLGKLADGLEQARALKRDLQRALGNANISLDREQGRLRINLFGQKAPVELLDVLNAVVDLPPLTAVLGWTADQRPVFLDFKAEDTSHALVAGNGRAGKTALLRTIALSLALTNRERDLQLVVIDGRYSQVPQPYEHSGLRPFNYLPHLLTPVVTNYDTAIETLSFLVEEIQHRTQHSIKTPNIVVLIDHLVDLVEVCGTAALIPLTHIIRKGAKSGVHLVLSTQRVEVAILQDIHDAYVPARIVGQVESVAQAEIAADAYDTQAEQLQGQGDFLAVVGQTMTHFQAAFINDYDLHLCLERLHHHRPPSLVAYSFNVRPHLHVADADASYQADDFEEELEAQEQDFPETTEVKISSPIIQKPAFIQAKPSYTDLTQANVTIEAFEEDDDWDDEVETAADEPRVWEQAIATNQHTTDSFGFDGEDDDDSEYEDDAALAWLDHAADYQADRQAEANENWSEIKEEVKRPWPRPTFTQDQTPLTPSQPRPQPTPFTPKPTATTDEVGDDLWEDDIPFSWESPRFNKALDEGGAQAAADLFSDNVTDEEAEPHPPVTTTREQTDNSSEPEPSIIKQTPAVQKNRFRGVRDLLSKIDETLPEKPPAPNTIPAQPSQREIPAAAVSSAPATIEEPKANGHAPQPEFRFNSLVPKVQRPKVVTSLAKPARPVPVEKQVAPQLDAVDAEQEDERADTVEFVDFDDGWGQLPAEEQATAVKSNSNLSEQAAAELSEENRGTITTAHENGAKTIRILNEEKPLPPTYPLRKPRRYRPTTHKLQ